MATLVMRMQLKAKMVPGCVLDESDDESDDVDAAGGERVRGTRGAMASRRADGAGSQVQVEARGTSSEPDLHLTRRTEQCLTTHLYGGMPSSVIGYCPYSERDHDRPFFNPHLFALCSGVLVTRASSGLVAMTIARGQDDENAEKIRERKEFDERRKQAADRRRAEEEEDRLQAERRRQAEEEDKEAAVRRQEEERKEEERASVRKIEAMAPGDAQARSVARPCFDDDDDDVVLV
eukprot:3404334-Rhodomonas_salina.1